MGEARILAYKKKMSINKIKRMNYIYCFITRVVDFNTSLDKIHQDINRLCDWYIRVQVNGRAEKNNSLDL